MCEAHQREEYQMSQTMKVLIAYDSSSCADAALNDLQCAGLPQKAEALILYRSW
jgi:hypothetical protein